MHAQIYEYSINMDFREEFLSDYISAVQYSIMDCLVFRNS